MTFEEHGEEISAAIRAFNRAVTNAKEDGLPVKTILSGDGSSIYTVEVSCQIKVDNSLPPKG